MNDQDKILSFLRGTGPVLPAQAAKHINSNILLASAHLSELSSQGKVKLSRLKVGGSPLYYLPEHREKLQNYIHNLNLKDQQTLNMLKERKILKERNLDLLAKVSLRNIKDFAVPLNITLNNQKELFWKWYLLTDTQAVELVKSQFAPRQESKAQPVPKPETHPGPEKKTLAEDRHKKPLLQKLKEKLKPKLPKEGLGDSKSPQRRREIPDRFFPKIESFFQEKNIKIESKETLRKNFEVDFIVNVPSVVGRISYFCKAKNKKRCDEKDLSAAYMEARSKTFPLLFLYTNELTKKAQEMIESGVFENSVIKKLG